MYGNWGFGKLEYTLFFLVFLLPIPFGYWKLIELILWANAHLHIGYRP